MVARKEAAEAQRFRRRQLLAALRQGRRVDTEALLRQPGRGVYLGGVVALVLLLAVGAHGYLRGAPPHGWLDDGHVVVDGDRGGRYLSRGGTLHPVPNETSLLLLTRGGDPPRVTVPHSQLRRARIGTPLGDGSLPEEPPALLRGAPLTACTGRQGGISVLLGPTAPVPTTGDGALVQVGTTTALVADGRSHVLSAPSLVTVLSYAPDQVVTVSQRWLDLLAPGSQLAPLRPETGPPGPSPVQTLGTLVRDSDTSQLYVVEPQGLGLVRNRLSALLMAAPPTPVAHTDVLAAPPGPEYGVVDVPDALPVVPPASATDAVTCTSTSGPGSADYAALPETPDQVPDLGTVGSDRVTVLAPSGSGALLRSTDAGDRLDADHPDVLLTDGRTHLITSPGVLSALGWSSVDETRVPPAWLALLPTGTPLRDLSGS